ncbi:STAS domain-containing protein [Actinoplanes aureus]|uniref:Anti-sigma factor antagonist n=1 Tax=Actinoplanes aureus TaxID=2792083 RepID=A0A931CCT6_9ACTN|nr:STAS domain-containing protein [Actinoplanes aureus]MBG0563778.1 STAS domain-containing protein [Actinoplanes aureus]
MTDDYFSIAAEPAGTDAAGSVTSRVRLAGELDIDSREELRDALLGIVAAGGTGRMVVDLQDVRFIDSEAIGAIIEGYVAADQAGIAFRLTNAGGIVKRVIDTIGLDHLLDTPEPGGAGSDQESA